MRSQPECKFLGPSLLQSGQITHPVACLAFSRIASWAATLWEPLSGGGRVCHSRCRPVSCTVGCVG